MAIDSFVSLLSLRTSVIVFVTAEQTLKNYLKTVDLVLFCIFFRMNLEPKQILALIFVSAIWGITNPFISRGTKTAKKPSTKNYFFVQFFLEIFYFFSNLSFSIPFILNQIASVSFQSQILYIKNYILGFIYGFSSESSVDIDSYQRQFPHFSFYCFDGYFDG